MQQMMPSKVGLDEAPLKGKALGNTRNGTGAAGGKTKASTRRIPRQSSAPELQSQQAGGRETDIVRARPSLSQELAATPAIASSKAWHDVETRLAVLESASRRIEGQREASSRRLHERVEELTIRLSQATKRLEAQYATMEAKLDDATMQVDEVRMALGSESSWGQQRVDTPHSSAAAARSAPAASPDIQAQLEALATSMGQIAGNVEARLDQALQATEAAHRRSAEELEEAVSALRMSCNFTKESLESQLTSLKGQVDDARKQNAKELEAGLENVCLGVVERFREVSQLVDSQVEKRLREVAREQHQTSKGDGMEEDWSPSDRVPPLPPPASSRGDEEGKAAEPGTPQDDVLSADSMVRSELRHLKANTERAARDVVAARGQLSQLEQRLEQLKAMSASKASVEELSLRLSELVAEMRTQHSASAEVTRLEALETAVRSTDVLQGKVQRQVEELKDSMQSAASAAAKSSSAPALPDRRDSELNLDTWRDGVEAALRSERQRLDTALAQLDVKLLSSDSAREAVDVAVQQTEALKGEMRKEVDSLKESISSVQLSAGQTVGMDWRAHLDDRFRSERQHLDSKLAALDQKMSAECSKQASACAAAEHGETSMQIAALARRSEKLEKLSSSLEEQVGILTRDVRSSLLEPSSLHGSASRVSQDSAAFAASSLQLLVEVDQRLQKLEATCAKLESSASSAPEPAETGGSPPEAHSLSRRLSNLEEQVSKISVTDAHASDDGPVAEAVCADGPPPAPARRTPPASGSGQANPADTHVVGSLSLTPSRLSASIGSASAVVHQPDTPMPAAFPGQASAVLTLSWLPGFESASISADGPSFCSAAAARSSSKARRRGSSSEALATPTRGAGAGSGGGDGSQLATCLASSLGFDVLHSELQASPREGQPCKATLWLTSPPPAVGAGASAGGAASQAGDKPRSNAGSATDVEGEAFDGASSQAAQSSSAPSPILAPAASTGATASSGANGQHVASAWQKRVQELEGSTELLHSGMERVERRMLRMEESILGLSSQRVRMDTSAAQLGDLSPVGSKARLSVTDPGPHRQPSKNGSNRHVQRTTSTASFFDSSTINNDSFLPTANRKLSRSVGTLPQWREVAAQLAARPLRMRKGPAAWMESLGVTEDSDDDLNFLGP